MDMRDMLTVKHWEKINDNPETWIDCEFTVEDDRHPETSKVVRSNNLFSCNILS